MKKIIPFISVALFAGCAGVGGKIAGVSYDNPANWPFAGSQYSEYEKDIDTFFIYPAVVGDGINMDISNPSQRRKAVGKILQFKGVFDGSSNFYAPYYRQTTLASISAGERAAYEIAYKDVKAAFAYYLKKLNNGRPFILAGHGQGSRLLKDLMIETLQDKKLHSRLVAAYIIGYGVTREETSSYPWLAPAEKEDDTGVFISYNAQSKDIKTRMPFILPSAHIIKPLNWKTDSTYAPKELNKGAVFFDKTGQKIKEIARFADAEIDLSKNALIVSSVNPDNFFYPLLNDALMGSYHDYDYMFYYNNLKENVAVRAEAYKNGASGKWNKVSLKSL
jgi:hypothetical protein